MLEIKRANEQTIKALIKMGVLYADESGIHCNNEGIYTIKKNSTADGQI